MTAPRLRIGYVTKMFPRLSETFILSEILALERQGVEVEIFSLNPPRDPRYHAELAELSAPIAYLPRPDSPEMWRQLRQHHRERFSDHGLLGRALHEALTEKSDSGAKTLWQGLWIATQVRLRGIDHLHAHFASSATRVALSAARMSERSFSFTAHAKDIYADTRDHALLDEALEACAFAVTVTDFNVAHLRANHEAGAAKLHRIYNGLALDHVRPEAPTRRPTIVGVGRLVEKKGFDDLVRACQILVRRGLRFRCRIVGEGPERARLAGAIARHQLEDVVELAGALPRGAVLEAIRRCRVLTLPCVVAQDGNRDALPTVLIEAMALARPVVSTDLEGVTEMVRPEETGLLVGQREPEALADALERLLTDDVLAERLGVAGRRRAERLFDLGANVTVLRQLFEQAAAATGASRWRERDVHEVAS